MERVESSQSRLKDSSLELERISAADPGCTRIRQIPGIGPIVATAIVAAISNGAELFGKDATLLRGWGSCHDSILLEARRSGYVGRQRSLDQFGRSVFFGRVKDASNT